jgi:hypothetical protein
LPTGDANAILKRRDQVRASKNAVIKSDTAFDELSKP